MPGEKEQKHNPGPVTRAEFNILKDEIGTIRKALVGEDYLGGIVRDVADLKKEKSLLTQTIKSVVVPISITIVTAWILTGMPH